MARGQQIVARDFLGLCDRDANSINGRNGFKGDEKGKQGVSAGTGLVPSFHLLHDTGFASLHRPRLASDQLGQNVLASFANGDISRQFNQNSTFCSSALRGPEICESNIANLVGCSGFGKNLKPMLSGFTGSSSVVPKSWFQVGAASVSREKVEDACIVSDSDRRENVAVTGVRHPSWNKAAALQQLISLQSLPLERPLGKNRQGLADWLATHTFLSPQVEDSANLNQGNATCSQHGSSLDHLIVKDYRERGTIPSKTNGSPGKYEVEGQFMPGTLQFGVSSIGHVDRVPEEHSSSSSPCGIGDAPNSSLYLSLSNLNEHPLPSSALRTQTGSIIPTVTKLSSVPTSGLLMNLPVVAGEPTGMQTRPMMSNSPGRPVNPQLTIFYSGTVNVYDDIPADKAQAIMLLAGSENSWAAKVTNYSGVSCGATTPFLAASLPSRPASPLPCPSATCSPNPPNAPLPPQKLHPSMQTGQNSVGLQAAASQANPSSILGGGKQLESARPPCTPSTSSTLPAFPPAVPRALPQARKASLARFLERRKERVHSTQPYPLKKDDSDFANYQGERQCLKPPHSGADGDCAEQKLGYVFEVVERAETLVEVKDTCQMDTEEQGWLKSGYKRRHGTELTGV